MAGTRILVVASLSKSLINFRGDYIKHLTRTGYKVFAAAPEISEEVRSELEELGATALSFKLQRTGLNPLQDLGTIRELKQLMKEHQIQLVFPYTIKPVIYSSFAAKSLGIPVISLITGLGFTFSAASPKARFLQGITEKLYKRALRTNKVVIFQNKDDRDLFLKRKIITAEQPTAVVSGSGVNLNRYPFRENSAQDGEVVFVMVARLIREKGIHLYVEAAKNLKSKYPQSRFLVVGSARNSPSAIDPEELQSLDNSGTIQYLGSRNDIPDILREADVFVLPTYYREGIPRSILEALSIGMPIITTDTPGCRETVVYGKNGYLIPPKDLNSLIDAMEKILEEPSNINSMGKESRKMAEERFDVRLVNQSLLGILEKAS